MCGTTSRWSGAFLVNLEVLRECLSRLSLSGEVEFGVWPGNADKREHNLRAATEVTEHAAPIVMLLTPTTCDVILDRSI